MNFDTPDGRLLVATCNEAQMAAVQRMIIAAFEEGINRGATIMEDIAQQQLTKALDQFVEEIKKEHTPTTEMCAITCGCEGKVQANQCDTFIACTKCRK